MRKIVLILLCVVILSSCGGEVHVTGVHYTELMSGATLYYAQVSGGDKQVNKRLYDELLGALEALGECQKLMCTFSKDNPLSEVDDWAVCRVK